MPRASGILLLMKGPKVLMFGWEFPPHNSGGLGTACLGIVRALADLGTRVTFVLPRRVPVDFGGAKFVFAGLEKVNFKTINSPLYGYITAEKYSHLREQGGLSNYGATLFEEVERYGVEGAAIAAAEAHDVIHAHDWLAYPAGLAAKSVSGKPLVVHVHATEFDRTGGTGVNEAVYKIEREGMEKADQIVAVSNWTKQVIVNKYGIDPDKIKVVHNGVDADEYQALPSKLLEIKKLGYRIVLFVGRITIQKGPDYFIRAAKRVLQHNPKVYFVIVGSGDMERQIMREAAGLGIADRVLFAGFLRGKELDALYQSADLYVLPSVSEPFGITPLESLVNGTPVIISKQSGVAEVLRHALKVDFWDVEEMANQIISVLAYPSLHRLLKEHGQHEARHITWHAAGEKLLNLYRSLVPHAAA